MNVIAVCPLLLQVSNNGPSGCARRSMYCPIHTTIALNPSKLPNGLLLYCIHVHGHTTPIPPPSPPLSVCKNAQYDASDGGGGPRAVLGQESALPCAPPVASIPGQWVRVLARAFPVQPPQTCANVPLVWDSPHRNGFRPFRSPLPVQRTERLRDLTWFFVGRGSFLH